MKSVGEIASDIWPVVYSILPILGNFWPWSLTLTKSHGHRHLGHWMRLIRLYISTMYEVCADEIASEIWPVLQFFTHFEEIWLGPVTFIVIWVVECVLLCCIFVYHFISFSNLNIRQVMLIFNSQTGASNSLPCECTTPFTNNQILFQVISNTNKPWV